MNLARHLLASASTAIVAGCVLGGGYQRPQPPPTPSQSLVADVVGLATDSEEGPCNSSLITLDSGDVVTMFRSKVPEGCQNQVTPLLLGDAKSWEPFSGVERLVMAGTLNGTSWIATARWHPQWEAWCVIFKADEGAYWEGDGFHLASGLVVPAASDFRWLSIDRSDLLPLRAGDDLCLNERGEAVGANVWTSY